MKSEFALRTLDAGVGLADRRLEAANLGLGVDVVAIRELVHRLPQDLKRLAHFQKADHDAVIDVTLFTERDAEVEAVVDAVGIHLADVVVHTCGAQHWPGDTAVDEHLRWELPDVLRAREKDLVADEEFLHLIEEWPVVIDDHAHLLAPTGRQVIAATAEAHEIRHHPRASEVLEKVEDPLTFPEGIH